MLTSKQLADNTGVSARTISRWTEMDILPKPTLAKHPSGRGMIGYYPGWVERRVRMIVDLQRQGRPLDDIKGHFDSFFSNTYCAVAGALIDKALNMLPTEDQIQAAMPPLSELQGKTKEEMEQVIDAAFNSASKEAMDAMMLFAAKARAYMDEARKQELEESKYAVAAVHSQLNFQKEMTLALETAVTETVLGTNTPAAIKRLRDMQDKLRVVAE